MLELVDSCQKSHLSYRKEFVAWLEKESSFRKNRGVWNRKGEEIITWLSPRMLHLVPPYLGKMSNDSQAGIG